MDVDSEHVVGQGGSVVGGIGKSGGRLKVPVHVEAEISKSSRLSATAVNQTVREAISSQYAVLQNGSIQLPTSLIGVVESVRIVDLPFDQKVSFWQAEVIVHSYRLQEEEPEGEYLDGESGELPLGEQLDLPSTFLKGLWESIIVEESIKTMLLNYCSTSLLFARSSIDSNMISWNKMILLHGPPGTGKTSLCKALAQKIVIRHAHLFQSGLLFEVNCHSLFSKWFSESGKLVMKLFQHIADIADDDSCLVTLLVDEVESIVAARSSASRSGEPGDAIRVVNAVLTSLDQLRRRKNVLVMCTSNMQSSLDEAFLDRLDLNVYIGNPPSLARRQIISSCTQELANKGLLVDLLANTCSGVIDGVQTVESTVEMLIDCLAPDESSTNMTTRIQEERNQLYNEISSRTEGLSGRALRKLPVRTFASIVGQGRSHYQAAITIEDFLRTMLESVDNSSTLNNPTL